MSDNGEQARAEFYRASRGEVLEIRGDGVHVVGTRWVAHVTVSAIAFDAASDETVRVKDVPVARLNLSWSQAKALHLLLGDVITAHEKTEGEVSLPSSFLKSREPK